MYFTDCTTMEQLKQEYHRLAFLHHPDKGGNTETMQAINEAFEEAISTLETTPSPNGVNDLATEYRDVIDKVIGLPDIDIEICGTWIWISGNTYPVKTQIKAAGFFWGSKKKKWYWRPADQQSTNRKTQTMDWIRKTHGSVSVGKPISLGLSY